MKRKHKPTSRQAERARRAQLMDRSYLYNDTDEPLPLGATIGAAWSTMSEIAFALGAFSDRLPERLNVHVASMEVNAEGDAAYKLTVDFEYGADVPEADRPLIGWTTDGTYS